MSIEVSNLNEKRDWLQVQKLLQSAPMSASFPLAVARPAGIETAYPLLNGCNYGFVGREDDQLMAYLHSSVNRRHVNATRTEMMTYFGDARVNPDFRRRGIAKTVYEKVIENLIDKNVNHGIALVINGNSPILKFMDYMQIPYRLLCQYQVTSRFVTKKNVSAKSQFERFQPKEKNWHELRDKWRNLAFGPCVTVDELKIFSQNYPGIRFYRRKNEDRIAFALWDQSEFRQLLLTDLPLGLRLFSHLWNFSTLVTGAHKFPKIGQSWRSCEMCFMTEPISDPTLEAFIVAEAWNMQCHAVNMITKGIAPNWQVGPLRGPRYSLEVGLYTFSPSGQVPLYFKYGQKYFVDLGFV